MIDLRSDTVTKPTLAMVTAMTNADVGDDVFSEDPSVNALQDYVAKLLGKEDALFVPSGCMGNQICLALHTTAGDEVIVESESHIFHYETSAPSIIARVQLHCVASERGQMPIDSILSAIRPGAYYYPRTSLICLENSHNRHGGTVLSLDYIKELRQLCNEHSLALHCDGARLWNTCIATGISPRVYAQYFDTLSVCLSKGLGAPIGSLIVGNKEHCTKARRWRKILGGGMRQVGVLASAGLYALQHHLEGLALDHSNAKMFADEIQKMGLEVANTPETNIVLFRSNSLSQDYLIKECELHGVRFSTGRADWLRAVFHHQVSTSDTQTAIEVLQKVFVS